MTRVWLLTTIRSIGVVAGTWSMWDWPSLPSEVAIPWWVLAVMFYFAAMGDLTYHREDGLTVSRLALPFAESIGS